MKRRWLRRGTTNASVIASSITDRKSLGRLAALFALIAVIVLAALSAGSPASLARDKARKASAKTAAKAQARNRRGSSRAARRALASRKTRKGKAKAEVARKERDGREELEGKEDPAERYETLLEQEEYWATRLTYPTGEFDPAWVSEARREDANIQRGVPAGRVTSRRAMSQGPLALSTSGFTALGPSPERMTGCSGCFDYGLTAGRVNAIAIDPTTTTSGSIVAYVATVGGGVWKTTNCCSAATTWSSTTDAATIGTTSIDTVVIDPNNHNTIYAGTGDLNFGSFSMGSQGILKSTDAGATWTVLGDTVFVAALPEPAGQFPQYQAVGKVRVDPNNSNKVVAGTKTGLYLSYDGGSNWTGPCYTNALSSQRQDITGLELSNIGGTTRILAAVGTRGFATPVQYNLDQNGANGLYGGTLPASGCPSDFTLLTRNDNGFIYGTTIAGSPYATGNLLNAGTGTPYGGNISTGNQLGRMDITVAPSNPNYIYAQVGSIAANNNVGCGNTSGCQLGVWSSIDGGATWTFLAGSQGGALRNCLGTTTSNNPGDYPQNWYDQGMAVDPNNPDRLYIDTYDTWLVSRTGTSFYNVTCGYNGSALASHVVHVDHHALAFVPGSSSILLEGSDGGIFSTANADAAVSGVLRPTWVNMDTGLNTIEFYSGDISGFFATSATPSAAGGAQDNGPSTVLFTSTPSAQQWQMGTGGDGFFARIDPVGTGTTPRYWLGNNSGGLSRCTSNCTSGGATWTSRRGAWTGDQQSFVLPFELFHGDVSNPANDCGPAGATTGCGHLIAGTVRVWETLTGATGTNTWYVNSPANLTKATLGNRSYINQLAFEPSSQNTVMVGTNDGNVQLGFNLGGGSFTSTWVNVTGGNSVLPNRPVLDVAFDPKTTTAPVAYAAVGGFDQNTPATPGHVYRVTCNAGCASFTWNNKSGNLPNIPVDSIIANPNFPQQVFAGTDFGLYYTDDIRVASPVWYRFNTGLPNVMIWDMAIDRGNTTLALFTRGRGAYAWPLPLGPVNPLATVTDTISGSGTYGSTAPLTATLTEGGFPLAGKTVGFELNGNSVGSAVTDASGVATLSGVSLSGVNAGSHPGAVAASFAGDSSYLASNNTGALTVAKASTSVTWSNPADIIYGTALDGTQLNASGSVPGAITYTPAAGTVLSSGSHNLHGELTPTDSTNYNNSTADVSVNVLSAILNVSMTADRNPAAVELNFNYKPVISNTGNAPATNTVLTDVLPAGVTYTASSTSQGTCTYVVGTHTVTCNLGTIPAGSSANVQLTVKPRSEGTLNDTASITASQWDPATGNSSASVNGLPAIKFVDLATSMTNTPDPVFAGQNTSYTLVLKNINTTFSATGVTLTDTLPASATFVSAATSQGGLVTPPVGSTGTVTANLGSIAPNANATVTITVKSTVAGVITDSVTATSNESDSNTANNSASAATTVKTAALLKVLLVKQVLIGGCENTTGNVYLTGPAGPGGVTVPLSTSSLAGVTVPASVFIPEGQMVSPAFNVTTSPVVTKQVGLVIAGSGQVSVSRGLTINVGSGVCPP
ncbi:MAG TPA: Ig-like domain repeat protein [Pyrinomonadaceae bacterium]